MRLAQDVKDSGIQWIGDIPARWDVLPIKKFGKLITGMTPPTDNPLNYEAETDFPWVRPEDINESGIETVATKTLSRVGWEGSREVRAPANLICCIGTIGKVGYIKKNSTSNQQITALQSNYPARFLYYALQAARKELEVSATGNVVWILNSERLGAVKLPHPSQEQAVEIATFLDRETEKIDELIQKQEKLIELLNEKRLEVIRRAITKGINKDAELKESNVNWISEVPTHWEIKQLKWITPIKRGASPRPIDNPIYFDDEGEYAWVRISDVTSSGIYLSGTEQRLSELGSSLSVKIEPGELFLSIAGSVGKPCIANIKACIHDGFVYFPKLTINPLWFYYMFEAKLPFGGLGKLGTQLNLNTDTIGSIYVPVPPENEIEEVIHYVETMFAKFNKLIMKSERSISLLKEHRASLISAAVTGKIDVRELV